MPLYMDHHQTPMSPEMQGFVRAKIQENKRDELGSLAVNVLFTDNETWCLTDTSSPEAVHKSHEAIGVTLDAGDIKEINTVIPVS